MSRLFEINLDDAGLPPPTPEVEQERKVAIFDLLEDKDTPEVVSLVTELSDKYEL